MLKRRLIAASVIITGMLLLLWLDFFMGTDAQFGRPGIVLCVLAILVSGVAADELWQMFRVSGAQQPRWLAIGSTIGMVSFCCGPALYAVYPADCPLGKFGWAVAGLTFAVVVAFAYEMLRFDVEQAPAAGTVINRLAKAIFIHGYLLLLFAFLVAHRVLQHDNALGQVAVITLIATVKLSDSFAFFVGRQFGTIKLAPRLSPGKTLQGALGAFIGAWVAVGINVCLVAPYIYGLNLDVSLAWAIAYGVIVAFAGMAGDLAESLLKRDSQCKDSSTWLLGLGGVLDIVDSLVFAAPASYLLWMLVESAG